MRRRHGRVVPEKDAPLGTRREPALLLVAEDEDEADDEDDAAALAASAGVPTCSRPHRGVRVRTGIACRSFWNSRYCT